MGGSPCDPSLQISNESDQQNTQNQSRSSRVYSKTGIRPRENLGACDEQYPSVSEKFSITMSLYLLEREKFRVSIKPKVSA